MAYDRAQGIVNREDFLIDIQRIVMLGSWWGMINDKLVRRFDELLFQVDEIEKTKVFKSHSFGSGEYVSSGDYLGWKSKAKNLLILACGDHSEHYKVFVENEDGIYKTNVENLAVLKPLLVAAKEDYAGGYCASARSMIQAEVFDSELEQASELLASGYYPAAAVIAGVVLETTIRQMCDDEDIAHGKLDKMNSDLTKAGRYNLLVQKQVTALADLRNKAAHGQNDQFSKEDVKSMIDQINRFLAERL